MSDFSLAPFSLIRPPGFGFDLQARMEALGGECTVFNDPRLAAEPADATVLAESRRQVVEFLRRCLAA